MTKEALVYNIMEKIVISNEGRTFSLKKLKEILLKLIPDIDENTSDGYHTFKELYDHRIALFIRLVNDTDFHGEYDWKKSKLHFDGTEFDGRFIVMGYINGKQISYHLPDKMRDNVQCKKQDKADKRDGHTSDDVVKRLLD